MKNRAFCDISINESKRSDRGAFRANVFLILLFALLLLLPFASSASPRAYLAQAEHDHSALIALDASFPTQSGNYYLTRSLEISSPVLLNGADLSIDLCGFDLVFTGEGKLIVGSESAASLTLYGCPSGEGSERIVLSNELSYANSVAPIAVGAQGFLTVRNLSFEVRRSFDRVAALGGGSIWENASFSVQAGETLWSALSSDQANVSLSDFSVDAVGAYALVAAAGSNEIELGGSLSSGRGLRLGAGVTLVIKKELTAPVGVYLEGADALESGEILLVTSAKMAEDKARNDLEKLVCLSEGGSFFAIDEGENAGQIAFQKDYAVRLYNGGSLLTVLPKKRGVPILLSAHALPTNETDRQIGWRASAEGEVHPLSYLYADEADASFSAVWERYVYSISYNGAFTSNPNPDHYSIDDGLILRDPERSGYAFEGWRENEADEPVRGLTIAAGETGNKAFTAVWTLDTYSIAYLGAENGENGVSNPNPTAYTAESGEFSVLPPSRVGYDFVRWEGFIAGEDPIVPEGTTGDLSFTAIWRLTQYAITYVGAEDGVSGVLNDNRTYYTVETPTFTIAAPARVGFSFSHWTRGDDALSVLEVPLGSVGAITLTAHWDLQTPIALYSPYQGTYDGASHGVGARVYHALTSELTAKYEWRTESGEIAEDLTGLTSSVDGELTEITFSVRDVSSSRALKLHYEISYTDASSEVYEKSGYVSDYLNREALVISVLPFSLAVTPVGTLYKTYGEEDGAIAYIVGEAVGEEKPALIGFLSRESGEGAGRYAVTEGSLAPASDPVSQNYAVALAPATYEIRKKSLTVTALPCEIAYGDKEIKGNGVHFDGFLRGDGEEVLGGALSFLSDYAYLGEVGAYSLTPAGLTSDDYEIAFASAVLTVLPKEVEVVWRADRLVYPGADVAFDLSSFASAQTGIDGVSIALIVREKSGKTVKAVGEYVLAAAMREENANFVLTNAERRIEVAKRPITVRAVDQTISFGESPAPFSYSVEGAVELEGEISGEPIYTCDHLPSSGAAEYQIRLEGLTSKNYEIEYRAGVLRVLKRKVEIALTVGGGVEGAVTPSSATVTGALGEDVIEVFVAYEKESGAPLAEVPALAGVYVVRVYIDEANYKADEIRAPFVVKALSIRTTESEGLAEIGSENGIDPSAVLSVRAIEKGEDEIYKSALRAAGDKEVSAVLDVRLLLGEEPAALSSPVTVKLALPSSLKNKSFSLLSLGETAKTLSFEREGDYIVFEATEIAPVAFLTQGKKKGDLVWLVVLLSVLVGAEIAFGGYLLFSDRKKKRAAAFPPFLLLAAIPAGRLAAIVALSVLALLFGAADAVLALKRRKERAKANKREPSDFE